METIWRRSTFICRILKCVKTGDIWTHCCTTPDPWFHSMYLYTHIIDSKLNHYKKITFYHDQTHINFWQFWTQLRYDVDVDGEIEYNKCYHDMKCIQNRIASTPIYNSKVRMLVNKLFLSKTITLCYGPVLYLPLRCHHHHLHTKVQWPYIDVNRKTKKK
jgi:hypothetical protein